MNILIPFSILGVILTSGCYSSVVKDHLTPWCIEHGYEYGMVDDDTRFYCVKIMDGLEIRRPVYVDMFVHLKQDPNRTSNPEIMWLSEAEEV